MHNSISIAEIEAQAERLYNYHLQDKANTELFLRAFEAQTHAARFGHNELLLSAQIVTTLGTTPAWQHLLGEYQIAANLLPEAELTYRELLANYPTLIPCRVNLAQVLTFRHDYISALEIIDTLHLIDLPKEGIQLKLRLHYMLGDLDKVVENAKKWLTRINPDDSDVAGLLSSALIDQGNAVEAKQWAEKALGEAINGDALTTLGMLHLDTSNAKLALTQFHHALEINPRDGRAWFGLGMAELGAHNQSAAEDALHKAKELFPGYIGTWQILGWLNLRKGNPIQAKEYFERGLELNRNFADSHSGLAAVAVAEGNFKVAEHEIETAFRLDKNSFSAWYARSLMLKAQGNTQQSKEIIDNLLTQKLPNGASLNQAMQSFISSY